jgi:hypothetical protein
VSQSAITADIHQSLDIQLIFAAQRAFYLTIRLYHRPDSRHFLVIKVGHTFCTIDLGFLKNSQRGRPAYPVYVGQAYFRTLIFGKSTPAIRATILYSFLSLTLFMFRIFANDAYNTFAFYYFAVFAYFLD